MTKIKSNQNQKNRSNWILLAVVVLLGAYAYFGEYKGKENKKKASEEQAKIYNSLKLDQISEVSLESSKGNISLKRSNNGWEITQPILDMADSEAVESWLKQVIDEKSLTTAVEGNDIKWNFFGFDKEISKLKLKTNLNAEFTIEISSKKNFENNVFIRRPNENKVIVGSSMWASHATKNLFELRNKKIFRHQISNIQGFEIINSKGKVEFKNKDAQWVSDSKKEWVFDQNKVRESIAKLSEAQVTEIVAEKDSAEKEKAKLKLSKALITMKVVLNDKSWSAEVYQVGKEKINYIWVKELSLLAKPEMSFVDKYSKISLSAYRDLQLPFKAIDISKAKKINLKSNLKAMELLSQNNQWILAEEKAAVNSNTSKEKLSQENILEALKVIKNLTAYEYLAAKAKDELTSKLVIYDESDKVIFEFQFSESKKMKFDDIDREVRLAKTNFSSDFFWIDDSEIKKLKLDEFVEKKSDIKPAESSNQNKEIKLDSSVMKEENK